jgi:hypothetical protein
MDKEPLIGPVVLCAVVTRDLGRACGAYVEHMGLLASEPFDLDADTARALGMAELADCPARLLGNGRGRQWLLQIEYPAAATRDALASYGWMAQEILVEDVDALAAALASAPDCPFEVLRPPRDLDMSSLIRACQVRGPDGEILYLTQVNGEVPGSALPQGAQGVDHLFIAVLSSPDRDASMREYETLSGSPGVTFDTRISVVNQHRGWDLERKHPIATVQLAGCALVEIDGLPDTAPSPDGISAGTAALCFAAGGSGADGDIAIAHGPLAGHLARPGIGSAGERYTLLFRAPSNNH